MPTHQLVISHPKNCIGCLLCVLASVRISKSKIGLSDGFITVYPKGKEGFDISVDYASKNDFEEIVTICPRNCFKIDAVTIKK
ncbi:hypothetical protein L6255_02405 [Candidatus Parcubacteria bacterium]|nr:hypothetical protein [Patescibacteria group bacterium]MBU4381237.1 hypothetical protein [Patescibacteria group bacterium]MCG2689269.1 hypothetical protein [Candidatus Parcubacteria bacterium]